MAFESFARVRGIHRRGSQREAQNSTFTSRQADKSRSGRQGSCSCLLRAGMEVLSRVLSAGMQGDDVRELQEDLKRLDIFIPPGERKNAIFGPATRKAVMNLQRAHFSESRVSGIVDQATANLISSEARNRN